VCGKGGAEAGRAAADPQLQAHQAAAACLQLPHSLTAAGALSLCLGKAAARLQRHVAHAAEAGHG
jgi:hypothetical protein